MPIDAITLLRTRTSRRLAVAIAVATLAACSDAPSKEEIEAAKNTFICELSGERLVIRFDTGEARLLMPGGDRVTLYQISSASGVRFTNGLMELRGKGTELQFIRDGTLVPLVNCQPYALPQKGPRDAGITRLR